MLLILGLKCGASDFKKPTRCTSFPFGNLITQPVAHTVIKRLRFAKIIKFDNMLEQYGLYQTSLSIQLYCAE